ncbi:MAG: hypothetical protein ACFFCS_09370 [Candidatus Hodarchaeota archaeon]
MVSEDKPQESDPSIENENTTENPAFPGEVEGENPEKPSELWEQIGFHKPLAGFFYNLTFSLITMLFGVFMTGAIIQIFYPYPESNGYRGVTGGIFSVFYVVMDLGTHMTMDRFIAENRIKNPGKMLQYIQFFIWYQAFTGLVQTTIVSLYAIYIVPNTDLAYGVWLMLIVATYQYPGYLGVFGGVLGSLQQYNRTAVLGFITGQGFQRITEFTCVLLGRWWGMQDPAIGEIMGIAIGANIGVYIDDFFAMWLSAYYFSKAMKQEGFKARDCFRVEFDRKLIKEAAVFGIKTGMPSLIGVATGLIILWQYIEYVPQYTTFSTLSGLIGGIAGFVNWAGVSAPTPLLAEAYLNGKKKLTQYYIAQSWRYMVAFQCLFLPATLGIYLVIGQFFDVFSMENYLLAIPFFFPNLIREAQQPYTSFADALQLGTNHPTFLMGLRFAEEMLKIFFQTLWVVWLRLPEKYGLKALIWIIPCGIYPAILFKTIIAYFWINHKIVKIKFAKYQTFVAPPLASMFIFGVLAFMLYFVFPPLEQSIGFIAAIIILLVAMILLLMFGYLPLTGLLGAWDTENLRDFRHAAVMSGPSRFYVMPMYKLTELACKKSKLHNRFRLDWDEAMKEAQELVELKKSHQEITYEDVKKAYT